jgi:hypothetical protein
MSSKPPALPEKAREVAVQDQGRAQEAQPVGPHHRRLRPRPRPPGDHGGFIEATAVKHVLGVDEEQWAPGKPLKLLLAGYVGTRNTGADVRVEEMIRQFRHVVGDDQLEMAIMTSDEQLSAGYFRTVEQLLSRRCSPSSSTTTAPATTAWSPARARCSSRSSPAPSPA